MRDPIDQAIELPSTCCCSAFAVLRVVNLCCRRSGDRLSRGRRLRLHASAGNEGAACAIELQGDPRARATLMLVDKMANDRHAIDDARIRDLTQYFSPREIIQLSWFCGNCIGTHRFMHRPDMIGSEAPIIAAGAPAQDSLAET